MISITESESLYHDLEKMSVRELLESINTEDQKVPLIVRRSIPDIEKLVEAIVERMKKGGRIFYIGSGTSGRLGIVDASEIPPTFGLDHGYVIGLIAGGDGAIRKAVEMAEDNEELGWIDLQAFNPTPRRCHNRYCSIGYNTLCSWCFKKSQAKRVIYRGNNM